MQRIPFFDVIKCIAIMLVCIGHCYAFIPNYPSVVRPVIYSFHMSLFMILCGFFADRALSLPWKDFIAKKGRQLLIPALSTSLLLGILVSLLHNGTFLTEIYGGVWFLKALFFCFLIVFVANFFITSDIFACLVSSIVLLVIPYGGSLMINYYLLFFWTGYFLKKKYHIYIKHRGEVTLLMGLLFVSFIAMGKTQVVDKITLNSLLQAPGRMVVEYLCGLSGSLLTFGLCYYVCHRCGNSTVIKYISNLGRYTMGIYVIQTFILEKNPLIWFPQEFYITPIFDYLLIPIIGIAFTIVSFYLVRLLSNVRIIDALLFGSQYSPTR